MRLRAAGMWLHLLAAGALMLCVWVLLVWVGSRPALKALIDMTPQQRSTIDQVTVDLLRDLPGQGVKVEFHLFFDQSAGQAQDQFQRQRQRILERLRELTVMLLRQYEFHGGEAVRVRQYDQYADLAATREATQRFQRTENDVVVVAVEQSGRPPRHRTLSLEGDLGVVDIPQLQPEAGRPPQAMVPVLKDFKGEEALSSALKSLLIQGTPVAYFLRGNSPLLDLHGSGPFGHLRLLEMLSALGFEARELDLVRAGAVPKDAAVVVSLEQTRDFADSEVRILHDWLRRGGRLFLNYSWSPVPDHNVDGGELGRLLGFEVGPQAVLHLIIDRDGPSVRGLDGDDRVSRLDLFLNGNHPVTMRLARGNQALQLLNARPLGERADAPSGVRREPLLFTGPQAWLARTDAEGRFDTHAPRANSALSTQTVGAVIEVDGEKGKDGRATTGAAVVVSGLFCNNFGMELNQQLAANIFNWLSERRVLLDIRGSAYVARHLKLAPQQLDRIWWFLVVGVPGAFLALGMFVHWRRRDR